jgi:hypothetical protein
MAKVVVEGTPKVALACMVQAASLRVAMLATECLELAA